MNTFPTAYVPEPGLARRADPRWLKAQFNDEIRQQRTDGAQLNQIGREFQPRWVGLTRAQANEIDTFLAEQIRLNAPFLWTPPDFPQRAFRCSTYTKTYDSCRRATVSATFREAEN
jgi:phage-related protein